MIDQQERYYNILKLNRWFALSSLIFAGIFILTFADDYQRPWKKFQKEFRSVEIEKISNNLAELNINLDSNDEYNALKERLSEAKKKLQDNPEYKNNVISTLFISFPQLLIMINNILLVFII